MNNISVKERNKKKVIKCALDSFVKNGIEAAKISDIAQTAGLTERSVFRYFETKGDLVLQTLILMWDELKQRVSEGSKNLNGDKLTGIEQIYEVLTEYSKMYYDKSDELLFVEEAEIYLYRLDKVHLISKKQMLPFKDSSAPLAAAISNGLKDGTVTTKNDLETLYYNTFDTLLGIMQKLSVLSSNSEESENFIKQRLDGFCRVLTNAYII